MNSEPWQQMRWPTPLGSPPEIAQIGIGIQGQNPVERYQRPDLWCLHLYRYEASVHLDGRAFPIYPGDAGIIPANTTMEYHVRGRSPHLYVHFRCVGRDTSPPILAMQNLGDDFGRVYEQMEQVINVGVERARARLWEVLWQIAERTPPNPLGEEAPHPAVRQALSFIGRHLDEPLRVPKIARTVGVSDSYLARLFQQALGVTVIGYIRERRIQRAAHLLRHSTLPVKAIAALVGLPDLHQFNIVVHAALGQSPRAVRQSK